MANVRIITDVTYSELVTLINTNLLNPGIKYKITDFATTHYILAYNGTIDGNPINTGNTEHLILTANSTNTFLPEVYSEQYPQDILHYDWNPDNWLQDSAFSLEGVIIPNFKGVIFTRHDTLNNNIMPEDFRNTINRRWKRSDQFWMGHTIYNLNDIVQVTGTSGGVYFSKVSENSNNVTNNNYWEQIISYNVTEYWNADINNTNNVDDFIDVHTFSDLSDYNINNNIFSLYRDNTNDYNSTGSLLNNNVFHQNSVYNNTFGSSFCNNTIYYNMSYNNIGYYFNNNVIGASFSNNVIVDSFSDNTIGNSFGHNNIGINFLNNNIGDNFEANTVDSNFNNNNIGNGFNSNNIGIGNSYFIISGGLYNNFGCYNSYINFLQGNNSITFGNNNTNITFLNGNNSINIGNDNNYISFGNSNIYDNIGNNNNYINFASSSNMNNIIGNDNSNITFQNGNNNNTFGNNNNDITFNNSNMSNIFNDNNSGITFGNSNTSNTFGDNNIGNLLGDANINNKFGNYNLYNTFVNSIFCNYNTNNTFYDNCRDNIFMGITNLQTFSDATFQLNNMNNTMDFTGIDFTSATHVYGNYNKDIFKNSLGNIRLSYYNDTDVLTVVNANA